MIKLYKTPLVETCVGAKELNGKVGQIVEKNYRNSGRYAVDFDNHKNNYKALIFVPPKLFKVCNLKPPDKIPLDKDEPWPTYKNPDGTRARIRIENGKGEVCIDCHCDLDGMYYLYEMEQ